MRFPLLFLASITLGSLLVLQPVRAQPVDPVPAILEAYQQVDYERAERLAREALADIDQLLPTQLVEIHKVLAFIAFSQGYEDEAERHFVSALSLNPDLSLDPALVSPLIIDFFEALKATAEVGGTAPEAAVRYVVVQDVRTAAALRSLVVPGWGQLHKGHGGRAAAFLIAWGGTATAAYVSHVRYGQARDRYEDAADPNAINEAYSDYNRWYRTRNNLIVGVAVVWAVSYVEALMSPGAPREGVRLQAGPRGAALQVRF